MFLIFHSYYGGEWGIEGYVDTEEEAKQFVKDNESKYIKYMYQKVKKLSLKEKKDE